MIMVFPMPCFSPAKAGSGQIESDNSQREFREWTNTCTWRKYRCAANFFITYKVTTTLFYYAFFSLRRINSF